MLRMYLMQTWYHLSDEGIEDSIYDSYAMRSFMPIDFHEQQVSDATTLLKFCHMHEKNRIGGKIFADVNKRLDEAGLMMHGGMIVDASLIAAPKSTKNREDKRYPDFVWQWLRALHHLPHPEDGYIFPEKEGHTPGSCFS